MIITLETLNSRDFWVVYFLGEFASRFFWPGWTGFTHSKNDAANFLRRLGIMSVPYHLTEQRWMEEFIQSTVSS